MDMHVSPEETEIIDAVRDVLGGPDALALRRNRILGHSGSDEWKVAGELGVFSLALTEENGGAGLSVTEEALAFRELGRALSPVGFIGSALAARACLQAGHEQLAHVIAAGNTPVAMGLPLADDVGSGRTALDVFDLEIAEHVVVVSPSDVRVLPASAVRVERTLDSLDPTMSLTRAVLGGDAEPLAQADDLVTLAHLLIAAMLVGVAERSLDMGVQYAKDRHQFGKPIGANQAIKHACADMAVRSSAASAQLNMASVSFRDELPDSVRQVETALRLASLGAAENSRTMLHMHGALGFTWEHDAHLLVTRAIVLDMFGGGRTRQQQTILDFLMQQTG